ncbi:MAG: class I SAM-dependent methyltransferase, partial [Caulobacteraceae bacterium]|nr:class I SAM-dependent methyltransferase [Caulobacter sp.]
MSLYQYFRTNTDLPINKWTHYFSIYERHFHHLRDKPVLFFEIGSGQGGSSRMWRDYFGPLAQIVTMDIRPECKQFEADQIAARIGNQSDYGFLRSVLDEFGCPDLVLDDGSHVMADIKASLEALYPRMPRNGIYMVEDTHTSYWRHWGGGLGKSGTFIEEMKDLIDAMHGDNPHHASEADIAPEGSALSALTSSLHFYNSIVVLERGDSHPSYARSI